MKNEWGTMENTQTPYYSICIRVHWSLSVSLLALTDMLQKYIRHTIFTCEDLHFSVAQTIYNA